MYFNIGLYNFKLLPLPMHIRAYTLPLGKKLNRVTGTGLFIFKDMILRHLVVVRPTPPTPA